MIDGDLPVQPRKPAELSRTKTNVPPCFVVEDQPCFRIWLRQVGLDSGIEIGIDGRVPISLGVVV